MTLSAVLDQLRAVASSSRDLGERFERLIVAYLQIAPTYDFRAVWLWMDWPERGTAPDTGIDIVAEENSTGDIWAIQCKCYDSVQYLDKGDIDAFFTTSGKAPFSKRLIVSTTDNWSKHAEAALKNQQIPVTRLGVYELEQSPVDWESLSQALWGSGTGRRLEALRLQDQSGAYRLLKPKKVLRPHQREALEATQKGFLSQDRGKLIMACGTGKTFTALKIAETEVAPGGLVLFLVPSISLLSQTLREWTAETALSLHSVAVCSDTQVGKRRGDEEDLHTYDLPFPPTTAPQSILEQVQAFRHKALTVIFSTYQSIQAIADAQALGLGDFDLVICDEAHRTTGVSLAGREEGYFQKIHDQKFIRGKKRLYMTATPRIYVDSAKVKAVENEATVWSMDDEGVYGPEFYRLDFSAAVSQGLLTDYKVLVLAVDEKYVSATFQRQLADKDNALRLEDAARITGCWNGLSKRFELASLGLAGGDLQPMRRAVAFCNTIEDSQRVESLFAQIIQEYRQLHPQADILDCEVRHVDGTQNALERNQKLAWLKAETEGNVCRILSNARCLSEGVDVPALDAVMFLAARNSQVDVVQSVGRVMRKAPGKTYGYIILPVGIPADTTPEAALQDNEKYKVVWQVLQALRSHDDRFNAIINQLELNQARPPEIGVVGVGDFRPAEAGKTEPPGTETKQLILNFPQLEEWKNAIYAKIVLKCGSRRFWEDWAKDVAKIAEGHIARIQALVGSSEFRRREAFDEFLTELRENLNPNIAQDEAIEMLAQHLITEPVFDALFEGYRFTERNPVSAAMQKMLDLLEGQALEKDRASLTKFYASVRERAKGVDNAEGRQKIIVELYDKFFRSAFPRMAERLGIVYTPVEVVDFIVHSADQALRREFGLGLTDEGVHILDPFTGTGTFMVRLLQSGLIKSEDLERKFRRELHANEIVLLAYYIAAINIEETYHGLQGGDYQPFEGIVLTDTFQLFEGEGTLSAKMFPENNQRARLQKGHDIQVIIGNPPYSVGQANIKYPQLDDRIRESYAKYSTATNKNSLYDSYVRSIRWASDRIKDKGLVCFVSNGSFIDNNAMDGLRKCLTDEFTSIYCFNLRGNARTSGEQRRMEKGNVFGEGTRTNVAITLLVKNPEKAGQRQLFYHDIGDYLSREDKLRVIQNFRGINGIQWQALAPNQNHDWINQRDPAFEKFISLGDKKDPTTTTIFDVYSRGVSTSRDVWCYNFSQPNLKANISRMISFYNSQVESYRNLQDKKLPVEKFIDHDPKKISWSRGLKNDLSRCINRDFNPNFIVQSTYRPFCKQWVYFDKYFNDMIYQMPKIFPDKVKDNLSIVVTGLGSAKDFSALISNMLSDLEMISKGQCFPLYTYEKQEQLGKLFPGAGAEGYARKENISGAVLLNFQTTYRDKSISKEDIFYYVYSILHSSEYKQRFGADLKKMLPRIPYAQDFWAFSQAGRELAQWHLNYETIEPYPLTEYKADLYLDEQDYRVEKMTFGKQNKKIDKTTLIYNSKIKLADIPLETYDYIVNGKSALDWIIERYQITKDKDSGIVNDPNNWSDDPYYILNLVKRIVRVSLETVRIVGTLPPLNEK